MSWDDAELLDRFERSAIPGDAWTHREHIRIAYLYLTGNSFDAALARMRSGINALNAAHAVPDAVDRGYHETMTITWMRLVAAMVKHGKPAASSGDFCDKHPHLLCKHVPLFFYSRERIMSVEAKRSFVEPDLTAFPRL